MPKCLCCENEGKYSILLASGPHGDEREYPRWYIPNQTVREHGKDVMEEVWFCHPCMRRVEDNLRATILYLQSEHGVSEKASYSYLDDKIYERKFAKFIEMCNQAKDSGVEVVVIHSPQVLGDNYAEVMESLTRLSNAGLGLQIVPQSK